MHVNTGIIHYHLAKTSHPMEIPWKSLDPELLEKLLEELVSREGTDYGATEKTLEQKIAELTTALQTGKARLLWNSDTESASIDLA